MVRYGAGMICGIWQRFDAGLLVVRAFLQLQKGKSGRKSSLRDSEQLTLRWRRELALKIREVADKLQIVRILPRAVRTIASAHHSLNEAETRQWPKSSAPSGPARL